jgi:hypothetical protein
MTTTMQPDIAHSELVQEAIKFWFTDTAHIRSPFPVYIQEKLQAQAVAQFAQWLDKLSDKAKDDINDEIIAEKLEETLFEAALPMVHTEDERITLLFPFLPRMGDQVASESAGAPFSIVIGRSLSEKEDRKFLDLQLKEAETERVWKTQMEIPG